NATRPTAAGLAAGVTTIVSSAMSLLSPVEARDRCIKQTSFPVRLSSRRREARQRVHPAVNARSGGRWQSRPGLEFRHFHLVLDHRAPPIAQPRLLRRVSRPVAELLPALRHAAAAREDRQMAPRRGTVKPV